MTWKKGAWCFVKRTSAPVPRPARSSALNFADGDTRTAWHGGPARRRSKKDCSLAEVTASLFNSSARSESGDRDDRPCTQIQDRPDRRSHTVDGPIGGVGSL